MRVLQKALEKGAAYTSPETLNLIKNELTGLINYLIGQCETEQLNECDIDAFIAFCEINFEANFDYTSDELLAIVKLSTSLMNADLYFNVLKF